VPPQHAAAPPPSVAAFLLHAEPVESVVPFRLGGDVAAKVPVRDAQGRPHVADGDFHRAAIEGVPNVIQGPLEGSLECRTHRFPRQDAAAWEHTLKVLRDARRLRRDDERPLRLALVAIRLARRPTTHCLEDVVRVLSALHRRDVVSPDRDRHGLVLRQMGQRPVVALAVEQRAGEAASPKALKAIRQTIREWTLQTRIEKPLDDLAQLFNPYIRGWINYYSHFYKSAVYPTLRRIHVFLLRRARRKFKRFRQQPKGARDWLARVVRSSLDLFAHWPLLDGQGRTLGAV